MLEISIVSSNKLKIFSHGIEASYTGKSIIYRDNTVALIFYYYENFSRCYIVKTGNGKIRLPYCEGYISIIDKFDNSQCRKLRKELQKLLRTNKIEQICSYDESYFLKLGVLIKKRGKLYQEIEELTKKYRMFNENYY